MKRTHGLSATRVYKCWHGIKQRMNPNWRFYYNYGGRGIRVCAFISESLGNFINLMGDCPDGRTLDRINNNGNYSCGLCPQCIVNGWKMNLRWATPKEQCRNRRNNHIVTIDKKRMTVAEVAEIVGISTASIHKRIRNGRSGTDLLLPRCDSCATKK